WTSPALFRKQRLLVAVAMNIELAEREMHRLAKIAACGQGGISGGGKQYLILLGDVFAELARHVHLGAEQIFVADDQRVAEAYADAAVQMAGRRQHIVDGREAAQDVERRFKRLRRIVEDGEQVIGFLLDDAPAVAGDG